MTEGNKRVLGGSQVIRRRIAGEPSLLVMASMDFAAQNQGTEIGTRLGGKRKDSGYQYNAFSMDINTGKSKLLESGTPFTQQWLANAQGQPIVRSEWNPELQRYSVLVKDGGGWRRILELKDAAIPFSPDWLTMTRPCWCSPTTARRIPRCGRCRSTAQRRRSWSTNRIATPKA